MFFKTDFVKKIFHYFVNNFPIPRLIRAMNEMKLNNIKNWEKLYGTGFIIFELLE